MRKILASVLVSFVCSVGQAGDFFYAFEFPLTARSSGGGSLTLSKKMPETAGEFFNVGVCRYLGAKELKLGAKSASMMFAQAAFAGADYGKYAFALCVLAVDDASEAARKNSEAVIETLRKLDAKNYAPATRALAKLHWNGRLLSRDLKKSAALYEKAFMLGDDRAAVEIALFCDETGYAPSAPAKLFVRVKNLVKKGNVEAKTAEAVLLLKGVGCVGDVFEANRLLKSASDSGDCDATFRLAMNYFDGVGVVADEETAVSLLEKSAAAGHVKALNNLGVCYQNEIAVPKDITKAVEYFRRSADLGYNVAQNNLGAVYAEGLAGDMRQAFELFKSAAESGNEDAFENLARCYFEGLGTAADKSLAAVWYEKAARLGSVSAKSRFGAMLVDGDGVKRDFKFGIKYLREAAAENDAAAISHLGACYWTGTGVEQDTTKALDYFRRAAKLGDKSAKEILRKLHGML